MNRLLLALLLLSSGCVPELLDESEDAIENSGEATPEATPEPPVAARAAPVAPPQPSPNAPPTTRMGAVADASKLDLTLRTPPKADEGYGLAVTAVASGPNLVLVTATYAPGSPAPRPVLPPGAELLGAGEVSVGRSLWQVRPPVKGSHYYGATITDGSSQSSVTARCCAPGVISTPTDPPAPGHTTDDGVEVMR